MTKHLLILGAGVDRTTGIDFPLANTLLADVTRYLDGPGTQAGAQVPQRRSANQGQVLEVQRHGSCKQAAHDNPSGTARTPPWLYQFDLRQLAKEQVWERPVRSAWGDWTACLHGHFPAAFAICVTPMNHDGGSPLNSAVPTRRCSLLSACW